MNEEKKNFLSTKTAVFILSIISCSLWGSAPIFIKLGYESFKIAASETMNILLFAGMRFALAGILVIIIYSIINRKPVLPQKTSWKAIISLALSQTALQYFFYYVGVANASGVKASILSGSSSVIGVLIACYVFHQEKMTRNKSIGCIAGIAGIILVNMQGDMDAFSMDMSILGEGFVLISAISASVSAVLIRKFSQNEDPVMLSGWQFFSGGVILCIVALAGGAGIHSPEGSGYFILVYLAFVSAVAYTLKSMLLKYHTVSSVTVYNFLIPVVGVILAAVLLNEKGAINLYTIAAMILICLSIWIVNFAKEIKKKKTV